MRLSKSSKKQLFLYAHPPYVISISVLSYSIFWRNRGEAMNKANKWPVLATNSDMLGCP